MDLKLYVIVLFLGTVIGQVNTENIKGLIKSFLLKLIKI